MAATTTQLSRKDRLTLVERKRRQWAEERAEQEEWYPFGKPGAGAPLRSPLQRAANEDAASPEKSNSSWPQPPALSVTCSESIRQTNGGVLGNMIQHAPVEAAGQMYGPPPTAGGAAFRLAMPPPCHAGNFYGHSYSVVDGQPFAAAPSPQPAYPLTYYNGIPMAAMSTLQPGYPYVNSTPCRPMLVGGPQPTATGVCHASPYFGDLLVDQRTTSFVSPNQQPSSPLLLAATTAMGAAAAAGGHLMSQSMCIGDSRLSVESDPMSRSCDYNVHKRRTVATAPKDQREVELQQLRTAQQKQIFDQQIHERQLQSLQQAERERRESERIERERREIEYRQMMESEMERSKWKRLKELEELRQNNIEDKWRKAQQEAQMLKHARLTKHATVARNEDEFVLVSGLKPSADPAGQSSTQRTDASSDYGRSPSIIPSCSGDATDDRPIHPQMQSPVELWDQLISKQISQNHIRTAKSTPKTKTAPAASPQETPLSRSKSDMAKAKQSSRTSIVRPLMRPKKERSPDHPTAPPPPSVVKSPTLGERLSRRLSRKSSDKSSSSPPPPSKAKHSASNLISQFSASLHLGRKKQRDSLFVPENPFGDSLGGANPLCQPLMTRPRRAKPTGLGQTADDGSPSSTSSSAADNDVNSFVRSPSLRVPSRTAINNKSPLYQSISSKIRCSTESHRRMLEQLFQLRKQLKDKHKQIEEAILNPVVNGQDNKSTADRHHHHHD